MLKVIFFIGCVFLSLFLFIENFICNSADVLLRHFPLDNPEAVIFTLTHNVAGAEKVLTIILEPYIARSIERSIVIIGVLILFSVLFGIKRKKSILQNSLLFLLIVLSFINVVLFVIIAKKIPLVDYFNEYCVINAGDEENRLYDRDYVFPDSVTIDFNDRRNLIFLVLESMEYNFQDSANGGNLKENLIPEITQYMKSEKNVSFVPGGITVKGTGWTIGEVVAKTCGVPLMMPLDVNTDGIRNFMGGAVCLTDLLKKKGYSISFIQGTNKRFASTDYFLETHGLGKADIYDKNYLEKKGYRVADTSFFLSISDRDLYKESKRIIDSINQKNSDWAVFIFTMNTHGPYGRLDSGCVEVPKPIKKEMQYPYVLKCASKQVDEFLKWSKKQSWYDNTTIAVMGDHPAMVSKSAVNYPEREFERFWLNFFINSSVSKPGRTNRSFTSFDMFPTVLEAMGAKIDGHALGLGRSLFSDEKTLIEKEGKDSLNAMLQRKGKMYNYLWE